MDLLSSFIKEKELDLNNFEAKGDNLWMLDKRNNSNSKVTQKRSKFDSNLPDTRFNSNIFDLSQKSSKNLNMKNNYQEQLIRNLNFSHKNIPFFRDSKEIKETNESWVYADSKISLKLAENSSNPKTYLNKFNDLILS